MAGWWPALAWAAVIFIFSTAFFKDDRTSTVILPMLHWLFPKASDQTLLSMHHYVRKGAHFVEYFVFSLLILQAIRAGRRTTRFTWALAAVAIVAGYAAIDEFHQSLVPGRVPLVTDVLLDTIGGIAAQIVAAFVLARGHLRRQGSG